ncbi:TetR/AcrR family transcriptional regulator [Actinomadura nitritigenes]|uniref:TetR/AcrR family transcriptional regulator n=1 Tax=Actinomadura nitritigenes TaxID=134602 RepID=UPI003D8C9A4E
MPRNRQDVDREVKIAEIREAAVAILRSGGHPALTHSAVAKDLGLARTAVYWYFPTKDELFTAALAEIYARDLAAPPEGDDVMTRLLWALDRLTALQPLTHALHERARQSEAAARLESALQESLCTRLRTLLGPRVDPGRLDLVTSTIIVFVEGLLIQPRTDEESRELLGFLVAELL